MARQIPTYLLHGLLISSEIPIDEEETPTEGADLWVRYGNGGSVESNGDALIADFFAYGRSWYRAYRRDDSYVLRFPELADFLIGPDLARVEALPVDGTVKEALSLLLAGTTLSFLLELRGQCVLHAGAVDIGGSAVAFAGTAGRGKSTLTALMCALGAPLVADDVLRIRLDQSPPMVVRGASSVRLRHQAASLVDLFEERPPTRLTYDDRLSLYPVRSCSTLPLGAVVLPRPNRTIEHPHLEQLSGAASLLGITEAARVKGWKTRPQQERQFEQFGHLSRSVPVYRADLPWSEPIGRAAGGELLAQLQGLVM